MNHQPSSHLPSGRLHAGRLCAGLLAAGLLATGASADRIGLADENQLTGTLSTIDARGRLVVESPNAVGPVMVLGSALRSIDFDGPPPDAPSQRERVHLTNGDVLPGVVRAIDADHIDVHTWFAGDLRIPRSAVASVDFNNAPQKLRYEGPGGPEGWINNDTWKFLRGTLTSGGRGTISRRKVLPEQFILRFHLAWNNNPRFRLYFCDDYLKIGGETDRYYFEVTSGGMQLKRQARNEGRTWHPLYASRRKPEEFQDKQCDIELRIDRTRGLLYVYVNGELEGRFKDDIAHIPTGSGIMLESQAGGETTNTIASVEIYEWDAISQLHRGEGHEDPERDAIITNDSERHGGELRAMVEEDGERILLLKNPHADALFHIPLRRTSVLYFRQGEPPSPHPGSFLIDIADRGRVHLSALRLDETALSGRHVLLGDIAIKREALLRLRTASRNADD